MATCTVRCQQEGQIDLVGFYSSKEAHSPKMCYVILKCGMFDHMQASRRYVCADVAIVALDERGVR
jgi:hypothetical protein